MGSSSSELRPPVTKQLRDADVATWEKWARKSRSTSRSRSASRDQSTMQAALPLLARPSRLKVERLKCWCQPLLQLESSYSELRYSAELTNHFFITTFVPY